jgi:hypothetical protein
MWGVGTGPFRPIADRGGPFELWARPLWALLQTVAFTTELLYNEVLIGQPGRQ